MEKEKLQGYIKERAQNKAFVGILIAYLALCLGSAVYWLVDTNVRNFAMSVTFTAFAPLLVLAEYWLKFRCGELFTAGVLTLAFGGILGTCFDFYTAIPFFDTLLHGLSGVLFACLGFTLSERFFGKAEGKKSFFGCLLFAICFSLAIAVVWEIFEYACTSFLGLDMMEDAFVTEIRSYLLAGGHAETVEIEGIVKTVIYYGNGQSYTINGYLDLGLIDTLNDMIICTVGAVVFAAIAVFSHLKCPRINRALIPRGRNE